MSEEKMRAIVAERPGGPEVLELRDNWPKPEVEDGLVLIRVKAFGINRGEHHTRLGHSPEITFPRVLGTECAGEVVAAPDTPFEPGETVVATTGRKGHTRDGTYAEYVSVEAKRVHRIKSRLNWARLASVPGTYHVAAGAMNYGIDASPRTVLIRGGTSAAGLMAADLARARGITILSSTRDYRKRARLKAFGIDHVLVGEDEIAPKVLECIPWGVEAVLDLLGTRFLADSFACVCERGIVCVAGNLGGEWIVPEFDPGAVILPTAKLTHWSSAKTLVSTEALQNYISQLEQGRYRFPVARVFGFEEIREAHAFMESNKAWGKIVVTVP